MITRKSDGAKMSKYEEGTIIRQNWKNGAISKIIKVITQTRYIIEWNVDGNQTVRNVSHDELERNWDKMKGDSS